MRGAEGSGGGGGGGGGGGLFANYSTCGRKQEGKEGSSDRYYLRGGAMIQRKGGGGQGRTPNSLIISSRVV